MTAATTYPINAQDESIATALHEISLLENLVPEGSVPENSALEADTRGDLVQEKVQPKLIIQQIDYAVNSSQIDLCSLELISELLLDSGKEVESSCIGGILQDYIAKIREGLEKVEVLAYSLQGKINE
jgi:hypothetical protein